MGCGTSSARQEQVAAATYQRRRASISHQLADMGHDQTAMMQQGFETELQCRGGSLNAKPGLSGGDLEEVLRALRLVSLFRHVPPKELEEAARTRMHVPWSVPEGTVILQEGDVAQGLASEGLFILLSGAAAVVKYSEPWGTVGKVVWEYRVPTALQRSVSRGSSDGGSEAWFGERTLIGPRAGAEGPNRGATVRAVGDGVRLVHIGKALWNKLYEGKVGLVVAHKALEQMVAEYDLLGGAGYNDDAELLAAKIEWLAAEHELETPRMQPLAVLRSDSERRDAPRQKLISKSELKARKRRASVDNVMSSPSTDAATPGSTRSGRRASVVVGAEEMAGLLSPTKASRAGARAGVGGRYVGGGERGRRRSVVAAGDGTEPLGGGGENFDAAAAATKWAAEREAEERKRSSSSSSKGGKHRHHHHHHSGKSRSSKDKEKGEHRHHHHHHRSSSKSAEAPEEATSSDEDETEKPAVVIGRSGRRRRSVV